MNERIQELAEQAGFTANDEQKVFLKVYEQELKKFAELIVRECLTFVEPMPGSRDIDDLALEAAREGIKQHFGVEE